MTAWPRKKLGEICRPRQWPTLSKSQMQLSGVPVYGANGIIGFTDKPTHHRETILVGCRGSCGTIHVLKPPAYANGNAMALDDLREDLAFLPYLEHHLLHRGFDDVTTGASQPQIVQRNINQIEIPLPPLEEQKRIAAILDQADDIRRKRQHAIERLNQLGQAIFHEMFGDPVTNPHGFQKISLGEMIKVSSGSGLIAADQMGGDYPVYGGNGVNGWHNDFTVSSGTIVIGRVGAYCGAVHVTNRSAWVTDNALVVSLKIPANQAYLAAALKIANLNQYAGRAAQPLISGSRIYPIEILNPPIKNQEFYETKMRLLEKILVDNAEVESSLGGLFSSLQHRAFTGQL